MDKTKKRKRGGGSSFGNTTESLPRRWLYGSGLRFCEREGGAGRQEKERDGERSSSRNAWCSSNKNKSNRERASLVKGGEGEGDIGKPPLP